jgi:hypothetical protein
MQPSWHTGTQIFPCRVKPVLQIHELFAVKDNYMLRIFFLMFSWLCFLIYLCNENQLDTLFTLSLFHQSTSTCFGHIWSTSSGGILYIYSNWYVFFAFHLTVCWLASRLANRQSTEKHNTYQLLYIYSIPPDDELQISPKHVEVDWRNKLRINSVSSWFLLHRHVYITASYFTLFRGTIFTVSPSHTFQVLKWWQNCVDF